VAIDFINPLTAGTVLVRSDVRSQNYSPGVSGWIIEADGDAEFNNLVIRGEFEGTNFVLNTDGLFIYDGTPGPGNLVANISPLDGTDAFGNDYLAGIVTYTGGEFAALSTGNMLLGLTADGYAPAALIGLSGSTGIFASSPQSVEPDASTWVRDAAIAATNNANVWTPETWHAPTLNANWSSTTVFGTISGGLQAISYRRDAEDNLWVCGCFKAAAGAGSAVCNFPAGYRPLNDNNAFPVAFISSGGTPGTAWMYVSMAGNLNINSQLGSAVTANTTYYVNAKIPLGNIA
jgi:hypothetical protein